MAIAEQLVNRLPLPNLRRVLDHPRLTLMLVVLVVHGLSPVVQTGDSLLNTATALSIVRHGDITLTEYPWITQDPVRTDVMTLGADRFWSFPWPAALVAVPMMAAADAFGLPVDAILAGTHEWIFEKPLSSLLTALTTVVLYSIAVRQLSGEPARRRALAFGSALVFAFATSAWSTSSMGLWTHGPSMLLLATGLWAATRLRGGRWWWAAVVGLCLMGAYCMRPTNALAVAAFGVLILLRHWRLLLGYAAGVAAVTTLFFSMNLAWYGTALPPYYEAGRLQWTSGTGWAWLGLLLSPSRGLLVFTPVALVAAAGLVVAARRRQLSALQVTCAAVVGAHWAMLGLFPHWWGGASFGPRLFTDMLPLLFVLALPAVDRIDRVSARVPAALLAVAIGLSTITAGQGALMRSSWCWNRTPVHVDRAPARIWDWTDPQSARGLRVLVSDGPREAVLQRCLAGG